MLLGGDKDISVLTDMYCKFPKDTELRHYLDDGEIHSYS